MTYLYNHICIYMQSYSSMKKMCCSLIKESWDVKTSELRTNRNDEGWCEIYHGLDKGWCATLHQITIDCSERRSETAV